MPVVAQIQFVQPGGGGTGTPGWALVGNLALPVTVNNSDNSQVATSTFEVVDRPVGSAVPLGVVQQGAVKSWTFTPDVRGGYLVHLTTTDVFGNFAEDFRVFQVAETTGRLIPPFKADSSSFNFGGQLLGWAPYLHAYLQAVDAGSGSSPTGTGIPHVVANVTQAAASLIVDADVDAAAGIDGSKVSPLFGAQALQAASFDVPTEETLTVGAVNANNVEIASPLIMTKTLGPFTVNELFRLLNPAKSFNYILTTAAIVADRILNFPLLTGSDTLVAEAFSQAITNKTIVAAGNTITDTSAALGDLLYHNGTRFVRLARGADTEVLTATATTISWAAKSGNFGTGALVANSLDTSAAAALVLGATNAVAVTLSKAGALTIVEGLLEVDEAAEIDGDLSLFGDVYLYNPAETFAYRFIPAAIAAARSITLPLLAADDTMVCAAFPQALTNKTIDSSNTIPAIITGVTSVAIPALAVDWALSNTFSKTIAVNSVFTFSNTSDGQTIRVSVTAGAGNTVTWPTVLWPGGTPPTQTSSGTDLYTFTRIGAAIYGSALQAVS